MAKDKPQKKKVLVVGAGAAGILSSVIPTFSLHG